MTADASLPPADERQPPLGEEELARLWDWWPYTGTAAQGKIRRLIAALRASRAEVERLRGAFSEGGWYRYICEAGHTTVTSLSQYDVCTAILPYGGTVPGLPCGADIDYRVIPYEPEHRLPGDGLGVAQEEEG